MLDRKCVLLLGVYEMIFADALKEFLVLKIKENCGFFNLSLLENMLDDIFARHAFFAGIFENASNDFRDGSLFETSAI